MGEGSCSAVKTNLGQRMPEIPQTSEIIQTKTMESSTFGWVTVLNLEGL